MLTKPWKFLTRSLNGGYINGLTANSHFILYVWDCHSRKTISVGPDQDGQVDGQDSMKFPDKVWFCTRKHVTQVSDWKSVIKCVRIFWHDITSKTVLWSELCDPCLWELLAPTLINSRSVWVVLYFCPDHGSVHRHALGAGAQVKPY